MSASSDTTLVQDRETGFVRTLTAAGSKAVPREQQKFSSGLALWSCIGLLSIGGFLGVSPELCKLWQIWTTDPLRSIGAVLPLASIVLTLRVWRQNEWELRGTYWGLLLVAMAFVPAVFSERLVFFWSVRDVNINLFPSFLPIYLYASGVILLFAGTRVWRCAWFPLALLLFLQPVPAAVVHFCDLPLQEISAHIARSFAQLVGLYPANGSLLQLMFAPKFGMFIAPGCDGMRGAITLAYGALIVGYLKRVSLARWILYVTGSFVLGHIFNLLRLCALVLYYKIALAHPWLEHRASQADYLIGGLLFLIAAFLFLWAVTRKEGERDAAIGAKRSQGHSDNSRSTYWRSASLALLVLAAVAPAVRARGNSREALTPAVQLGETAPQILNERIPSHVGDFRLARAWQEEMAGVPALEVASFEDLPSDEVEIGIWLPPTEHSIQISLRAQGESPKLQALKAFTTADGKIVQFNTALYVDGVTDTLVGDTNCTTYSCQAPYEKSTGIHLAVEKVMDNTKPGERWVPIFFKVQAPHTDMPLDAIYRNLSLESQRFLSGLNCSELSQRFQ